MNREEFKTYIYGLKNVKKFTNIQQHHTASPSYKDVKNNHIALMKSMENYHVSTLNMSEIAQHFSTLPDGLICIGRPLTKDGGGFLGTQNLNLITIENIGNFDADIMTEEQKQSIVLLNALLCKKFNIVPSTTTLPYHCWVKNKSCPGTKFFGGNTREAAEKNFIPLIKDSMAALFYLDPPYYGTEKYYQAKFNIDDHERLCRVLKDIKGKFILSYNDCGYIRDLYKDFNIESIERNNNLTARYADKGTKYGEVIIQNY